jgi:putative two-component system response regulator
LRQDDSEGYLSVLVLTAQNDDETKLRALEKGAKDFVTKPFHQAEVLHRVRNLLEVRLLYNKQRDINEMLEDNVRRRTRELEETRLEIVHRLGRAGEFRDNETGMHVIRMSKSCELLALKAGLSGAEADLLLHASPMHDLGKIGIPDAILLKPGAFTPEEWEIMKSHTTIGGEILSGSGSKLMAMAYEIAVSHHEKWDGGGYPAGLRGTAIPLSGRIAALCDVFDALTSSRPYKEAWSLEKAAGYIRDNAGRHFDPGLTAHFLDILPQVIEIRQAYADAEITSSP